MLDADGGRTRGAGGAIDGGGGVRGGAAPLDARGVIQEVFLSPRVVDKEAFNDFAASLRRLIEEAAGQAQTLRSASADASAAREALRESAARNGPKVEAATRALAMLEQRAGDAERMLAAAKDAAAGLESLRADVDAAARAREAEFEQRLADAARRFEQRALDAEAQAEARLADMLARVEGRLAEAEARSARAGADAAAAVREASRGVEERLAGIDGRAAKAVGEAEARLGRAVVAAQSTAAALERSGAAAQAILGDAEAEGSLAGIVAQCERLRDEGLYAQRQLDALRQQSDLAGQLLAQAITDAAAKADEVTSVGERLGRSLGAALVAGRDADAALARRRDEIHAALAEPIALATRAGQELAQTIAELGERTGDARAAAESANADTHMLLGRLAGLVEDLQPWRGLLLEHKPGGPLPAPLASIVAGVRSELGRDIRTIAAALAQFAGKAGEITRSLETGAGDAVRPPKG